MASIASTELPQIPGQRVVVFDTPGSFTWIRDGETLVDVILVGAGGKGGDGGGGGTTRTIGGVGGGGGETVIVRGLVVTGDLAVTVGAGGTGGPGVDAPLSRVAGITARGGRGGANGVIGPTAGPLPQSLGGGDADLSAPQIVGPFGSAPGGRGGNSGSISSGVVTANAQPGQMVLSGFRFENTGGASTTGNTGGGGGGPTVFGPGGNGGKGGPDPLILATTPTGFGGGGGGGGGRDGSLSLSPGAPGAGGLAVIISVA